MSKKRFPEDLMLPAGYIRLEYWNWHDKVGTLAELLTVLERIRNQFLYFDCDAFISDHLDELGITADYIGLLDDPSDPNNDSTTPHTFSYRMGLVQDDIDTVNQLIRVLDGVFRFSDLPVPAIKV